MIRMNAGFLRLTKPSCTASLPIVRKDGVILAASPVGGCASARSSSTDSAGKTLAVTRYPLRGMVRSRRHFRPPNAANISDALANRIVGDEYVWPYRFHDRIAIKEPPRIFDEQL